MGTLAKKKLAPVTSVAPVREMTTREKCENMGVDNLCLMILDGMSLRNIAASIGIAISCLTDWVERDVERCARVREARRASARLWDEKAEQVIAEAPDAFELQKARELAHHYRWRAKAIAPREYGDKLTQEHVGSGGGPIAIAAVDLKQLNDKELDDMHMLLQKASGSIDTE